MAIIHGRHNDLNALLSRAASDELHITECYKSSELVVMRQHNDRRQSKCPTIFIYLMLTVTLDSRYIHAMENADAHIEGFNSEAKRLTQKLISAQQTAQQARQNLGRYTSGSNINASEATTSLYISQLERDVQKGERQLRKAQGDLDKATSKLLKLKRGSGRVEFNQVWIYPLFFIYFSDSTPFCVQTALDLLSDDSAHARTEVVTAELLQSETKAQLVERVKALNQGRPPQSQLKISQRMQVAEICELLANYFGVSLGGTIVMPVPTLPSTLTTNSIPPYPVISLEMQYSFPANFSPSLFNGSDTSTFTGPTNTLVNFIPDIQHLPSDNTSMLVNFIPDTQHLSFENTSTLVNFTPDIQHLSFENTSTLVNFTPDVQHLSSDDTSFIFDTSHHPFLS